MPFDLETLPDFPAILQLVRALWRDEGTQRGAAALVGAGFSINADLLADDTPRPPLWNDLRNDMRDQLYPQSPHQAPDDPLRLAEEYRGYLGQVGLNDFLRARIRDDAWRPSALHNSLVELPWSDILTTNWDTLLERAAREADTRYYEVVRTPADLAHARAPRIIKLHGSVGINECYVFAEDDYRTYTTRYAPFVNIARQVLIENELCLIGFSGDDPNFLQWSGWVRDELKSQARRIYLVGALDLGNAKRKLLESRNVSPIDLAPLVSDIDDVGRRHSEAIKIFIDYLTLAKPIPSHAWQPASGTKLVPNPTTTEEYERRQKDDAYAAEFLVKATEIWRDDRQRYPGWLVCPSSKRSELRDTTDVIPAITDARLALLTIEQRANFLYELAWRYRTSFWPIPIHVFKYLETIADPGKPCGIGSQRQLEIAIILLRSARVNCDENKFVTFEKILTKNSIPKSDIRAEVAYQNALRARNLLQYDRILDQHEELMAARDPIWRLRLAALYSERGEFPEAKRLINDVVRELRRGQTEDRRSLWIRSRKGWALWLARAAKRDNFSSATDERWPVEFTEANCDPWDELETLRRDAADAHRKMIAARVTLRPRFEAGHYRESSDTLHLKSHTVVEPQEMLDAIVETVGIPPRMRYTNLIGSTGKDVAELSFASEGAPIEWYLRLVRTISDHDDPLIESYFGRVGIARMAPEVARQLSQIINRAILFWRNRTINARKTDMQFDQFAVDRLRFFIELLARMTARQDAANARESFDLAMDLGKDQGLRHYWLSEPIGHLAEYAAQAVPPADRSDLVLLAIRFPTSQEANMNNSFKYPNPVSFLHGLSFERPHDDHSWVARIRELIELVKSSTDSRGEAILRLVYLSETGALSEDEKMSTRDALWSRTDEFTPPLPADTNLLPHAFALFPAPEGIDVNDAIRNRLYNTERAVGQDYFYAIVGATQENKSIRPSHERALQMFSSLTKWRPTEPKQASLSDFYSRGEKRRQKNLIGQIISRAVVPVMQAQDLTTERLSDLENFIRDTGCHTALSALSIFAARGRADNRNAISRRIRVGLISRDADEAASSSAAVETWARLSPPIDWPPELRDLVTQLVVAIETRPERYLSNYLWCAKIIAEMRGLSSEDTQRMIRILETLWLETAYERVEFGSDFSVTVSIVRAECVRVAKVLYDQGDRSVGGAMWLENAPTDPLPEVRFALS